STSTGAASAGSSSIFEPCRFRAVTTFELRGVRRGPMLSHRRSLQSAAGGARGTRAGSSRVQYYEARPDGPEWTLFLVGRGRRSLNPVVGKLRGVLKH